MKRTSHFVVNCVVKKEPIGIITFGSQVDVAIPKIENLKINVKPGDEVRAGISVISQYS